jgi:hypothetical protein
MVVFLVSGLWHGANWTFLIWGGLHGFYLVFGEATRGVRKRLARAVGLQGMPSLHRLLQSATVFVLVTVAWVFFRAASVSDAWYVLSHLGSGWGSVLGSSRAPVLLGDLGLSASDCWLAFLGVAVVEVVHLVQVRVSVSTLLERNPWWLRWGIYYGLALSIFVLGVFGKEQFIYFQF